MEKYHMRRQDRQITDKDEINEILRQGKYAVISMCRDNEPYIVTLSYGYDSNSNCLYFHTGNKGLKIDFLNCNPTVCATVIDDRGYIKNECGHEYKSLVMFGKMIQLTEINEKMIGMKVILNHLEEDAAKIMERVMKSEQAINGVAVLKLEIDEISGKKGR